MLRKLPRLVLPAVALVAAAFSLPPAAAPDLTGTWEFEERGKTHSSRATITLTQTESSLRGQYKSGERVRPVEGKVAGGTATIDFPFTSEQREGSAMVVYRATIVTPDLMTGTVEAKGRVVGDFTAARKK
jgi:hypothetical protein